MARADYVNMAVVPAAEPTFDAPSAGQASVIEEQLARIIVAARDISIVAEEILRDVSQSDRISTIAPHGFTMAPRLLAATEQQLASVAALLRQR